MSSSRKSVVYTPEFKLKVLEYYFKHGGERSFGIKSKTAAHFKIDKKTISRMLCNPEMVKKASRCLSQKKPLIMNSSKTQGGKSLPKDKHPHSGGQPQTSSVSKSIPTTGDSSRTTLPKTKTTSVDLPEDPDYSILKRMISSSVTGAANLARLLVTSTKEVQKSLLNECDLIFECKVCKNLFRSVVNFLAHKRIYCQDEFVNVKMMFSENNPLGMTSESSTIVVEPEPPPQTPPLCVGSEKESQSKIDLIAERLTSRNLKKRKFDELSSSSDKGSSDYYERLQNANASRSHVTRNCSLKLKDMLKINPHAVFQSFAAPGQEANEADIKLVKEIQQRKLGITAMMNSKGKIIDSRFGEPSSIDASSLNLEDQDSSEVLSHASSDGISAPSDGSMEIRTPEERYIYTCPICSIVFLTIGGCNKHLFNVHKKKKHQRDRLRKVIRSRAYKKTLTQDEIKALHNRTIEIKSDSPADASVEARRSQKRKAEVTEITSPLVIQCRGSPTKKLLHYCGSCNRGFLTPGALGSHIKYCHSNPNSSPTPVSESPQKKIAIQIRKDYKKSNSLLSQVQSTESNNLSTSEFTGSLDVPSELEKDVRQKLSRICIEKKCYCVPCKERFSKRSLLLRHAALHLEWTRFTCKKCKFRSFHKYVCDNHCYSQHKIPGHELEEYIVREDRVGNFNYSLNFNTFKCKQKSPVKVEPADETPDNSALSICNKSTRKSVLTASEDTVTAHLSPTDTKVKVEPANGNLSSKPLSFPYPTPVSQAQEVKPKIETTQDAKEEKGEPVSLSDDKQNAKLRPERPQRTRRTIEKQDFIYEAKNLNFDDCIKGKSSSIPSTTTSLEDHPEKQSKKQSEQPEAVCNGLGASIKADKSVLSQENKIQAPEEIANKVQSKISNL